MRLTLTPVGDARQNFFARGVREKSRRRGMQMKETPPSAGCTGRRLKTFGRVCAPRVIDERARRRRV